MRARYDKRLLFPEVAWEQVPAEERDAVSALLMAERLVREEAWADAYRFARLAVTLGHGEAKPLAEALFARADNGVTRTEPVQHRNVQ